MQAVQKYARVNAHSGVHSASPHRLIQMLMQASLSAMAVARGHILREETEQKGLALGKAINRIEGLRASLDTEAGGEIAANLHGLYEYMKRRLLEANLNDDAHAVSEVESLMHEVKAAWDTIELPATPINDAGTFVTRRFDAAVRGSAGSAGPQRVDVQGRAGRTMGAVSRGQPAP